MDALLMRATVEELRREITGARIEKIHQSARDQVILLLRGNRRLLLHAGAGAPRLQLTAIPRENPAEPPRFCMLLRKHLSGGRIVSLEQPPLERLARLEIDASDELGRAGRRTLVLEAMGRRSNLILLDEEGRILDCLRRVDGEMSPSRQVLPGLFYAPPPSPPRLPLTEETEEGFRDKLNRTDGERTLEGFLLENYFGLSRLYAREVAFRTGGETDCRLLSLDTAGRERFWEVFSALSNNVRENTFTPILLSREGKPLEAVCLPVLQYGPGVEAERYPDFSALLDALCAERERQERLRQRGADLLRTAATARDRLRRKLAAQERDYAATRNRDELRVCGDLITANLYRMERGQSMLVCENFYGAPGERAEVPLDPLLTPQQNAARYYKRYAKARTAEKVLAEQMEIARRDIAYLESVLEELERGETEQDFREIRRELRQSGFLRSSGKGRKETFRPQGPREFRTSSGLTVVAGRNNRQNDELTKRADRRDLWLHTKELHGSHVILRTQGREVSQADVEEAAAIAAWYSQGRESGRVAVDVARVRNVKKPPGARPGMVTYTDYRTVYVKPGTP